MRTLLLSLLLSATAVSLPAQKLNEQTLWKIKRLGEFKTSPDGKTIIYKVNTPDIAANKTPGEVYSVPVSGGPFGIIIDVSYNAFNLTYRADGKKIGFLSAKSGSVQMYEINPDGSGLSQVSDVAGGINGFLYSPDMKKVALIMDVKLDKNPAEIYPDLPKTNNARIIDGLMYRHWDSWHDYAYSHIFIASYANGKISDLKDIMEGERYDAPLQPFGGTEQLAWSPDSKTLAYTSRKQNGTAEATSTNSDIYLYTLASGKTENITSGNPGYDTDPAFSPDGKKIAWLSMARAGYEADKNRIMVMDLAKRSSKEITANMDQTTNSFTWNYDGNKIYFIPTVKATKQVYVYEFKTGIIKALTEGDHDYLHIELVKLGKEMLVGNRQSISSPSDLYLVDGEERVQLQRTDLNKELLNGITWGRVEKRMVKSTDGKEILTWVIYPPDFDPNKKYPTLLYCQGGPQSPVSQFFSFRWNFQLMAANGYIVVAPNRRGLPGFGQEWNDAIGGDYGGQCMRDYLSAIDDVAREKFVNKDKLGAVGASFGGYSVYWLAGNHEKRFKAFISHCGMFNMESWYGSTEEMWFANYDQKGAYWDNPGPYNKFSPHKYVKNWDAPMLVIHNEKDFRVPLTQGMEAFNAAQLRGIPSRFLYFPDENHWVTKPQNGILWQRVFFEWLDTYLK